MQNPASIALLNEFTANDTALLTNTSTFLLSLNSVSHCVVHDRFASDKLVKTFWGGDLTKLKEIVRETWVWCFDKSFQAARELVC
jgi:hypothetical protein